MKKLIREIRKRLRFWLGIEDVYSEVQAASTSVEGLAGDLSQLKTQFKNQMLLGVDVGFSEPTVIIIASSLGGGRIEIINTHIANPKTLRETIDALISRCGNGKTVTDKPVGCVPSWWHSKEFVL